MPALQRPCRRPPHHWPLGVVQVSLYDGEPLKAVTTGGSQHFWVYMGYCWTTGIDDKYPSTKYQVPRTKYHVPSTIHHELSQTPSTKYQVPSTVNYLGHQVPSTKYQVPSTKYRELSQTPSTKYQCKPSCRVATRLICLSCPGVPTACLCRPCAWPPHAGESSSSIVPLEPDVRNAFDLPPLTPQPQ